MSAFLPLLGDKRTSNAPSPGVAFMSTRRSERAQPFEARQGDRWRLSVSARGPRETVARSLRPLDPDQGERLPAPGGETEGRWLQRAQRRPRHLLSKPWAPERFSSAVRGSPKITTLVQRRESSDGRSTTSARRSARHGSPV